MLRVNSMAPIAVSIAATRRLIAARVRPSSRAACAKLPAAAMRANSSSALASGVVGARCSKRLREADFVNLNSPKCQSLSV